MGEDGTCAVSATPGMLILAFARLPLRAVPDGCHCTVPTCACCTDRRSGDIRGSSRRLQRRRTPREPHLRVQRRMREQLAPGRTLAGRRSRSTTRPPRAPRSTSSTRATVPSTRRCKGSVRVPPARCASTWAPVPTRSAACSTTTTRSPGRPWSSAGTPAAARDPPDHQQRPARPGQRIPRLRRGGPEHPGRPDGRRWPRTSAAGTSARPEARGCPRTSPTSGSGRPTTRSATSTPRSTAGRTGWSAA